MHSCDPVPSAPAPSSGPSLLLQLGRLIIRSRSSSPAARQPHDRLLHAKIINAKPSTSQQVQSQPKLEAEEPKPAVEAQLSTRVQALWDEQIPVCIEVLLAPDCAECYASLCRSEAESFDKHKHRALLLERWTMRAQVKKSEQSPAFSTSQWLLNAVRSQLHFSQLAAWLARLKETSDDSPTERRRKLSRETCNYKKIEANCDDTETSDRKLNIVYSIQISQDSYKKGDFVRPPNDHKFPVTDIGNNLYLNVILESLPRLDDIPHVKCACQKRKTSKDTPPNIHEELVGKLNDLCIENKFETNVVDDRMLTPCSENGKHKCNCDDESDGKDRPKVIDDRRLKEIAKYKRRLRKECKIKKLHDSTSSEGDGLIKTKETHTSIPILQAARFDRFRAIGCYRNQTYLTLPASRIETKSPFVDNDIQPPAEFKKTNTVSTQTEDLSCQCGTVIQMQCDTCNDRGMIRSDGNYNLASIEKNQENGARRKCEEDEKKIKKHKCDTFCDNNRSISNSDIIKRPKLRRFFPIVDKIEKIVTDRFAQREKDMEELQLEKEDTVFSRPRESKRQKTFSISDEDYVLYEKCDYGTFDRCSNENSEDSVTQENGFKFPSRQENQVPSPTEMDRFRWRFDSAASMVFSTKTGLPLTSSPAPLRRGNNCFDFDDSINGISGIKSALFHPISPSPPPPASPASPRPPARTPPPPASKIRMKPSTALLGSFEESALKGRLEPVATVQGFRAELGACGAFCPPHRRLPVTVFFYAPGGTNAPYMGHINLGSSGYRVARSGTVQVSLFNPHGTLVKMFVVLYDLTRMPAGSRTFLRQRTLYMPAGAEPPARHLAHKWLRYLIHLRFMTSKSGKLYLHTDIRIIVSRKADLDTATAHSALFRPLPTNDSSPTDTKTAERDTNSPDRKPNRVFGGCSEFDDFKKETGYENQNGVSYELRSFTYAPDNPKYSPR
ncbi:protein FAM214A [Trichoplusia ni]|uniref:Protein FAM214A n=1 Tax=Trichoplusia ni TaxID=7111 RepID=A0A7E5WN73_TRINI|nr:protein FAM214A [Trichoplusia ni]